MFAEAALPKGYPAPGPVGEVIVKQYPAGRAAVVKAADLKDGSADGMFRPLFRHITKNHIEMSSPVDMTWSPPGPDRTPAEPLAMAFVYGDPAFGRTGKDGDVEVVDLPAVTVLSVGVRGAYDKDHFSRALENLNKWLADHPGRYKVGGPPRYLCYNSPFVPPPLRIGEVQLPVTAVEVGK